MATNVRENSLQQPVQSVSVETDGTTIDNLHVNSNSKRGSAWSVVSKVTIEHLHGDGNSQTTVIATNNPFQRRLLDTVPIWLADYDPDGYGDISSGCEIPLYHMPSTVESLLANLQTIVDRAVLNDWSHDALVKWNQARDQYEETIRQRCFESRERPETVMKPVKSSIDRKLLEVVCLYELRKAVDNVSSEELLMLIKQRIGTVKNEQIPDLDELFKKKLKIDLAEDDIDARVLRYYHY
ncbi:hypothetical protein PInf_011927 [Phytophthora infestans]|nr:hypothetical protein PInf_011927 [Phytophthora infestans]